MCGRARIAAIAHMKLKNYPISSNTSHNDRLGSDNNKHLVQQDVQLPQMVENISPGFSTPVVVNNLSGETDSYSVKFMKWGLIPLFTAIEEKPDHYQLFNKRIETVNPVEGTYFYQLVQNNKRCVAIFDGFYEWKVVGGIKHPHYIHYDNDVPLQFAAIYEDSQILDPLTGEITTIETFSILTSEPCDGFKSIHNRQPIFLSDDQMSSWLNPNASASELLRVLHSSNINNPFNIKHLKFHPVTKRVTDATYQQSDCSQPVSFGGNIQNFFQRSPDKYSLMQTKDASQKHKISTVKHQISNDVIDLTGDDDRRDLNSSKRFKKGKIDSYFS
jgi:putative SOS response-associated peptidase YedK